MDLRDYSAPNSPSLRYLLDHWACVHLVLCELGGTRLVAISESLIVFMTINDCWNDVRSKLLVGSVARL